MLIKVTRCCFELGEDGLAEDGVSQLREMGYTWHASVRASTHLSQPEETKRVQKQLSSEL